MMPADTDPPLAAPRKTDPVFAGVLFLTLAGWMGISLLGLVGVLIPNNSPRVLIVILPAIASVVGTVILPFSRRGFLRLLGYGIGSGMGLFGGLMFVEIIAAAGGGLPLPIVGFIAVVGGISAALGLACAWGARRDWTTSQQHDFPGTLPTATENVLHDGEEPERAKQTAALLQQRGWYRLLAVLPVLGLMVAGVGITWMASGAGGWRWLHGAVGLAAEGLLIATLYGFFRGPKFLRAISSGISALIALYSAGAALVALAVPEAVLQVTWPPLYQVGIFAGAGLIVVLAVVCMLAAARLIRAELQLQAWNPDGLRDEENLEAATGWDQSNAGGGGSPDDGGDRERTANE